MSGLLPSIPDTSAADGADPRVIGLNSEDADDLLSAMSSGTARDLLSSLHEEPATPSALADRAGTSLQNAQYHLDKLSDAGVIEVIDTAYSEKGREMKVYAPADKPLVVVAGDEEETSGLKAALASLLSGFGLLAVVGVLIEWALGDGGRATPSGVAAMEVSSGGVSSVLSSPGVLFFLGGSAVLLAGFAAWYVRR